MASMAEQLAADDAAVEAIRQKFGDAEAAKLAAELYKLRRAPAPSTFAGFPRWAVVGIALWLALLETADKLPQVLLAYPRYEAALADVKTKLMQPDLTVAQLTKAQNDATASAYQTRLAAATASKAELEADTYKYYPDTSKLQLEKAAFDTLAASFQPKTAETQLTQLEIATKKAGFDLPAAAAAAIKAEQDTAISNSLMNILSPIVSSLAGADQGKVQSILNPSQRLNELQRSMAVEQTEQAPPVNAPGTTPPPAPAPAPTPAPAASPPGERHRVPPKKVSRNNEPRSIAVIAPPVTEHPAPQLTGYEAGQQAAKEWTAWYEGLWGRQFGGAAHAFIAYQHDALKPTTCTEGSRSQEDAEVHDKCAESYARLEKIIARKRSDPQFAAAFDKLVAKY